MLQRVIRDPGGSSLIRVMPELCGPGRTVVNGSVLLVPAGTQAFVALSGQVVGPYWPGRYELMTGVDPFFVRLRNLMTGGEAPVSVTVFFVSTQRTKFMQLGTGPIPFEERRYRLTMEALASCSLAYRIADPLRTLETMVGTYQAVFSDEDLEPCLRQLVLAPLRQTLAGALNRHTIVEFNRSLGAIGAETRGPLAQALAEFGLSLEQFAVTAVNIPGEGWARLHELEGKEAAGRTQTDLEKDHLERIWGGNLDRRTLAEAMTGLPARGSSAGQASGGGMAAPLAQALLLSQLWPTLQQTVGTMAQTGGPAGTPPLPGRLRQCPCCHGSVSPQAAVCPHCGQPLHTNHGTNGTGLE